MTKTRPILPHSLSVIALTVAVLSTSCTSIGDKKLVSSHKTYNDAVQLTVVREVLANIVRSRYADPMQFLAVSAINAQFSVSVGVSGGAAGIGQIGTAGQTGGSISFSDAPTITFVPLSDNAFYNSLYGLFEVNEAVGFDLSYRFARTDPEWQALGLRFSFAAINGANDFIGGQYNQKYNQRIDALVDLLQRGASYQQIPEWDFDSLAIPKEKVTAEDKVAAFRMGLFFVEENKDQDVRLARYRLVVALTLPSAEDEEDNRALMDLGVKPGRTQYVFRPPMHATPGLVDPYAIWVTPRSMSDAIHLAARFVDVPAAHTGIVPPVEPMAQTSSVASSVRIRSSKMEPSFPYRVQHRGYWFYVDDSELDSKVFLEAMVAAYSSRVGSRQAGEGQPQIVLPVGGG